MRKFIVMVFFSMFLSGTMYSSNSGELQRVLYRSHIVYHQNANWQMQTDSLTYISNEENCYICNRLGAVQGLLMHQDEQCMVAVNTAFDLGDGNQIPVPYKYDTALEYPMGHVAHLYYWGKPLKKISKQDCDDLRMLVKNLPSDSAKSIFNGASMFVFPLNFKGEYLLNRHRYGRGVVVFGENNIPLILSFFMTDKSISDFNRYLSDFKGVLSFVP